MYEALDRSGGAILGYEIRDEVPEADLNEVLSELASAIEEYAIDTDNSLIEGLVAVEDRLTDIGMREFDPEGIEVAWTWLPSPPAGSWERNAQ